MVTSKQKYEEIRRKRLEENHKRLEELNLKVLSQDLISSRSIQSPLKQVKPRLRLIPYDLIPVRRSDRVADKPAINYKEVMIEPLEKPARRYSYQRRDLLNRVYASEEVRAYAIGRAEKIQSGLKANFPSFVKPMLQSHVTGGFWLGLPVQFSRKHLPRRDEIITLEDENGDAFETKYLAQKTGLSGGWRGFSIDHGLVDGDALVFELVSFRKFKVYIIKAYDEGEKNEGKEKMRKLAVAQAARNGKRRRAASVK